MKILTEKTFGVPNWILILAGLGGLYIMSKGVNTSPLVCPAGECAINHHGHIDCVTAPPEGCGGAM